MDEEPVLPRPLADPLHHIDQRFEPFDPVFDADEDPQLEFWPRKRRSGAGAKAAAAALGMLLGCGAGERARMVAALDDGIELQGSDVAATPDGEDDQAGAPDDGNPDPSDESGDPSDPGAQRSRPDERGLPG